PRSSAASCSHSITHPRTNRRTTTTNSSRAISAVHAAVANTLFSVPRTGEQFAAPRAVHGPFSAARFGPAFTPGCDARDQGPEGRQPIAPTVRSGFLKKPETMRPGGPTHRVAAAVTIDCAGPSDLRQ